MQRAAAGGRVRRYHGSRARTTFSAAAQARIRPGSTVPMTGRMRAGCRRIHAIATVSCSTPSEAASSAMARLTRATRSSAVGWSPARSLPPPRGDQASTWMPLARQYSRVPAAVAATVGCPPWMTRPASKSEVFSRCTSIWLTTSGCRRQRRRSPICAELWFETPIAGPFPPRAARRTRARSPRARSARPGDAGAGHRGGRS